MVAREYTQGRRFVGQWMARFDFGRLHLTTCRGVGIEIPFFVRLADDCKCYFFHVAPNVSAAILFRCDYFFSAEEANIATLKVACGRSIKDVVIVS